MQYMILVAAHSTNAMPNTYDSIQEARAAAEAHSAKHGVKTIAVKVVATCRPLPHPVEWEGANE